MESGHRLHGTGWGWGADSQLNLGAPPSPSPRTALPPRRGDLIFLLYRSLHGGHAPPSPPAPGLCPPASAGGGAGLGGAEEAGVGVPVSPGARCRRTQTLGLLRARRSFRPAQAFVSLRGRRARPGSRASSGQPQFPRRFGLLLKQPRNARRSSGAPPTPPRRSGPKPRPPEPRRGRLAQGRGPWGAAPRGCALGRG